MEIVVIGANGQLGSDLLAEAASRAWRPLGLDHSQITVEDAAVVDAALPSTASVVINTAAFHNLEACEREPERAYRVNAIGPLILARWAEKHGARLIHISTDYVFSGDQQEPYSEADLPRPVNVYGASKLSGEHLVTATNTGGAVVRVSALYGAAPCRAKGGDNFVRMMLRLGRERGAVKVVNDQWVSPTYTRPLAVQVCDIAAERDLTGVIHATANGKCSWYEFACAIFEEASMDVAVTPVASSEFPSLVRRPAYSVLANQRLQAAGMDRMPHWRESLAEYLSILLR